MDSEGEGEITHLPNPLLYSFYLSLSLYSPFIFPSIFDYVVSFLFPSSLHPSFPAFFLTSIHPSLKSILPLSFLPFSPSVLHPFLYLPPFPLWREQWKEELLHSHPPIILPSLHPSIILKLLFIAPSFPIPQVTLLKDPFPQGGCAIGRSA